MGPIDSAWWGDRWGGGGGDWEAARSMVEGPGWGSAAGADF